MKRSDIVRSSNIRSLHHMPIYGAFLTAMVVFLVFFAARNNQFVALDDYAYVVLNNNIDQSGWSLIWWAFASFFEGNWHPLTMLSLALDRSMWGDNPFGYHVTNIAIHSCTVFALYFLFGRMLKSARDRTLISDSARISDRGIIIGSIAGALFFGLHPLRVESMVWISERKDVLCLFFITTALLMYLRYVGKKTEVGEIPFWQYREYWGALVLAASAQMSKPTAVSLPLILCIVDWYPLVRVVNRSSFSRTILEKVPFFLISALGAVLTLFAQQVALKYAPDVSFLSRLFIACKALLFYIAATIWPSGLAAMYMHPGEVASSAPGEYLLYFISVVLITFLVARSGRKSRMFCAFWLFYVITLLPMLGVVQVGAQWAADRYSYLPAIGISLLWGGWVAKVSDRLYGSESKIVSRCCLILAASQLLAYSVQTTRQIRVWRTTETLATRIIEYYPHQSGAPYMARAIYRNENGRYEEALGDITEALKIALRRGLTRAYPEIAFEQAVILKNLGRFTEALTMMEWGIQTSKGTPTTDAIKLRDEFVHLAASHR